MKNHLGSCGILCNDCPAYIATVNNDNELRKTTADEWSKMFNTHFEPNDINCKGCHSDVLSSYCKTCEIRICGNEKALNNCSECNDYGCSKISEFHNMAPDAKKVLDALRNK